MQNEQQTTVNDPELVQLDNLAKLLDNQFRVPGTNYRFGLDGIIGLIPYVGDIAGVLMSGVLIRIMAKRGAGPFLMMRMMGNYALDALVGVIPFIGDLFDFSFKANRRNVNMLRDYYAAGHKPMNAKWSVTILGILFLLFLIAIICATWMVGAWVIRSIF